MGLFGFLEKDTVNTAPENDVEQWILGTYAMWSMYYGGEWKYVAGSKKRSRSNRNSMRLMLRRDWGISNKEELFATASELRQVHIDTEEAWDLCRGCQILGMGFIADWITREEMVQHSLFICREMQTLFSSWDELYESYLRGFRNWRKRMGDGAEADICAREAICRELKENPEGPWTMPWQHI